MPITLNSMSFTQAPASPSTVKLVSSSSNGTAAGAEPGGGLAFGTYFGQVYTPAVSTTGRYIAFKSQAVNLVAGDSNGFRDIFWKDTITGDTKRVNVSTPGVQGNAEDQADSLARVSMSGDGRLVAFASSASNLTASDANLSSDIFVRDMVIDVTTRISNASGGGDANSHSYTPRISGNGRYVAFSSDASNIVSGDGNGHSDVFVRDLQSGVTTSFTQPFNQFITRVQGISNDGRYILFLTDADNILLDGGGGGVFLYDRTGAAFTRVNTATNGTVITGESIQAESYVLSGDGRHVAFVSGATNWGPSDTNGRNDVYTKNLDTGVVSLVTTNAAGQQHGFNSDVNSISEDGRYISFNTISSSQFGTLIHSVPTRKERRPSSRTWSPGR